MNEWGGVTESSRKHYPLPRPPLDGFPPHIEVYVTGVAKCFGCGERFTGWEEAEELSEWVEEHAHEDSEEEDDDV